MWRFCSLTIEGGPRNKLPDIIYREKDKTKIKMMGNMKGTYQLKEEKEKKHKYRYAQR